LSFLRQKILLKELKIAKKTTASAVKKANKLDIANIEVKKTGEKPFFVIKSEQKAQILLQNVFILLIMLLF